MNKEGAVQGRVYIWSQGSGETALALAAHIYDKSQAHELAHMSRDMKTGF